MSRRRSIEDGAPRPSSSGWRDPKQAGPPPAAGGAAPSGIPEDRLQTYAAALHIHAVAPLCATIGPMAADLRALEAGRQERAARGAARMLGGFVRRLGYVAPASQAEASRRRGELERFAAFYHERGDALMSAMIDACLEEGR